VENLLFDLVVHKDLPLAHTPNFELLSRLGRDLAPAGDRRHNDSIPISEGIVELESSVDSLKTELMPRYAELLGIVAQRCQWNLNDFRVMRVTMKYPPAPTTAVFSYPLPERD
jgi:hypothetical protein